MSRDGWAALPRGATGCLQFVIVVFPDHTHLLFLYGTLYSFQYNKYSFYWHKTKSWIRCSESLLSAYVLFIYLSPTNVRLHMGEVIGSLDVHEGQKSKWVWSGNTTITQCRPSHGTMGKSHRSLIVTRHQEDKAKHPALSSSSIWLKN